MDQSQITIGGKFIWDKATKGAFFLFFIASTIIAGFTSMIIVSTLGLTASLMITVILAVTIFSMFTIATYLNAVNTVTIISSTEVTHKSCRHLFWFKIKETNIKESTKTLSHIKKQSEKQMNLFFENNENIYISTEELITRFDEIIRCLSSKGSLFSIFDDNGLRYSQNFSSQVYFENKSSNFSEIIAEREYLGKYNIIEQTSNDLLASLEYGIVESITTKYILNDKNGNALMVGKYLSVYSKVLAGKQKAIGVFNSQGMMIAYATIDENLLDTKSSIKFQFGQEIVSLDTEGSLIKNGGSIILPQNQQIQIQMDKFKGTIKLSSTNGSNLPLLGSLIILLILTADMTYTRSDD